MADPLLEQALLYLWITLGVCIEFLIVFFCYWLIPIEKRSRFVSFLTKKSYGVIKIMGKGKKITRHMVNLFLDYAVVRGGVFIFNPDLVYLEDGAPVLYYDEKDAFEPSKLSSDLKLKEVLDKDVFKTLPKNVQDALKIAGIDQLKKISEEIPEISKIYLSPVRLKKEKPREKVRDPQMVNAIFMKQKALAESEAWTKMIKQFKILMFATLISAAIAAALGFMCYDILSGGGVVQSLTGAVK